MDSYLRTKRIKSRRITLIAVMTALSVIGRFIPVIKSVAAITILSGVYLGSFSGFAVGGLTAIISNIYWGQGPWTPFQILAWGSIGFVAGLLSHALKSQKLLLLIYGAISGLTYSLIMDIWTVVWYNHGFSWKLYLVAIGTAVPYIIIYAISNVVFLYVLADPIGEKLERMHVKYGI